MGGAASQPRPLSSTLRALARPAPFASSRFAVWFAAALSLGAAAPARAFISAPVGGREGETDVAARVGFERGKVEPTDDEDSFQKASWEMYTLGVGHTFGALGPLEDFFLRLEGTWFDIPAEVNEHGSIAEADCAGRFLGAGRCEFYGPDRGGFVTLAAGFNAIHVPSHALGFALLGSVPIDVEFDKFVEPRIDYVALAVSFGVRFTSALSHESRLYLGSGAFGDQNATVATSQLLGLEWRDANWKIGLRFGPYFDGDLTERTDARYGAAYGPAGRDNVVRMMRFGVITMPYVAYDFVALELLYLQKLFGFDPPATQFYSAGVRVAF